MARFHRNITVAGTRHAWRPIALGLTAAVAAMCTAAPAGATNVLWYTYSAPDSQYRDNIQIVADTAHLLPAPPLVAGPAWTLDWFEPSDTPDFELYDVLVIHGGEKWRTDRQCDGLPTFADRFACLPSPDFSGILANRDAISDARGDRTVISGSDADFHTVRGDNLTDDTDPADPDAFDGALGYLVNSVNWAADGDGLGIVSWYHGDHDGASWWDDPASFLLDELGGLFTSSVLDDSVLIPPSLADHPLNLGLTSDGLSGWTYSFHGFFEPDVPGYFATLIDDRDPDRVLSLASDRSLLAVTEPASPALALIGGVVLLAGLARPPARVLTGWPRH